MDKEQNEDVEFAAGNNGGGNTRCTSGVGQEAKVPYPIVSKEHNQTKNPSISRTPSLTRQNSSLIKPSLSFILRLIRNWN